MVQFLLKKLRRTSGQSTMLYVSAMIKCLPSMRIQTPQCLLQSILELLLNQSLLTPYPYVAVCTYSNRNNSWCTPLHTYFMNIRHYNTNQYTLSCTLVLCYINPILHIHTSASSSPKSLITRSRYRIASSSRVQQDCKEEKKKTGQNQSLVT